jgi:hypothetical protein
MQACQWLPLQEDRSQPRAREFTSHYRLMADKGKHLEQSF